MTNTAAGRFSDRVRDYVRWRPDYPSAAIDALGAALELRPGASVADVGAGTGILTRQLAESGADVIAVDPNEQMLEAARALLRDLPSVRIVVGSAEATGLADRSVDAIAVGQAFHWFDHVATAAEFRRVLRPGGQVALIWNAKAFGTSGFLADYERMLEELVPEFREVRHEKTGDREIEQLYGHVPTRLEFPHEQRFDWTGVLGRAMSSSYAPRAANAAHASFVEALRACFDDHAEEGEIRWPYTTTLFVGDLR